MPMDSKVPDFIKRSRLHYEQASESYSKYISRIKNAGSSRLSILYGLRGAGKTTALFKQYLKGDEKKRLYLDAEEMALLRIPLLDSIDSAVALFGPDLFIFIDEMSTVPGWASAIKVAYDKHPRLRMMLSGSSAINMLDSKEHLARRAIYLHLRPLTLREYVRMAHGIELEKFDFGSDALHNAMRYDIYLHEKLKGMDLTALWSEYLLHNLPYLLENPQETLRDLVEKAIFFDIAKTSRFESATLSKFERLILLLSVSNKVSYDGISKDLGVSKSIVEPMLLALEQADIIRRVYPFQSGKSGARKEWKYYFMVPAIRKLYASSLSIPEHEIRGNMLEDIFAANFEPIFFSDMDFVYSGMAIEAGSRSKGLKQARRSVIPSRFKRIVVYNGPEVSQTDGILKLPNYVFFSSA